MDEFELEIKKEFLNEALMNLEEVEGSFMDLETSSDPKSLLDRIFRLAHNLKGGSRAVGFGEVAEFTHQLETLVLKIQKNEVSLSSNVVTLLLKCNDRLVEMLTALKADFGATFDNQDMLTEIANWNSGIVPATAAPADDIPPVPKNENFFKEDEIFAAPPPAPVVPAESIAPEPEREPEPELEPVAQAIAPTPAPPEVKPIAKKSSSDDPPAKDKDNEIVRVSLSKVDLLNDYVGELIVLQSVIQQQVDDVKSRQLQVSVRQMMKISKDIQSLSMSLRMLPVKPLVQKLQRVVRDTAKALNKEIRFEVRGEQTDVDKSVLDILGDPLIHILRNAVDHGIESTQDRIAAGKNPAGSVSLTVSNEGNHLVVEVRDDGKGINGPVLRTKAIEKGILLESQPITEKQMINLIFHPGFSTKSETSEISGRGVGMDVVKTNLEHVGGHVDVTTVIGQGSVFRMQIPLTLAVIEGLVVASNSNRYVVPLSQVKETINLRSMRVFEGRASMGSTVSLRGVVVPLFGIEQALGGRGEAINENDTGLIVQVGDRLVAIVVKDIIRAQQIVIKPLGNGVPVQRGWIGSCILGDGLPTLIVSPADLLQGKIVESEMSEI